MSPSSNPALQAAEAAEAAEQQRRNKIEQSGQPEQAVVIVTSTSLQTQGMAMVLSSAMQEQGVQISILLCDQAGDLAIESYASPAALKPHGMNPEGLLQKIIEAGGEVAVCALYLPNSGYQADALRDGISVAAPADMAKMMRNKNSKVFSF